MSLINTPFKMPILSLFPGSPSVSSLTGFQPFSDAQTVTTSWRQWGISTATQMILGAVTGAIAGETAGILASLRSSPSSTFAFSQTSASATFSGEGSFAGRSVAGLAADLRSGAISPSQVPVGFVQREGTNLIMNNRSAVALTEAGVSPNQWTLVNQTGQRSFENVLTQRLLKNGLTNQGTNSIRFNGCQICIPE